MAAKFNNSDVMLDNVEDAVGGRTGNKCDPCGRRKRSSNADQFCKTCSEFLCSDCCEGHTIYKAGDHDIGLASEAGSSKIVVDMKGLDRCIEHNKVFVFFCEDHDDLCCEICALAHHRKCDDLNEIAKIVKKQNPDMSTLNEEVNSTIDEAASFIKQSINAITKTKSEMSEICMEIDTYKETVISMFECAKGQVIKEMTDKANTEKTRHESRQLAANEAKESLNTTRYTFDTANKDGSATEKFIIKQVLQKRLQASRRVMDGLHKDDYTVNVNLVWNENVQSLNSLKEDICHIALKYEDHVRKGARTGSSYKQQIRCRPVRLELLKTMDPVKIEEDKEEPFVTGLDFLPNGRIVAVDNKNRTCFIMCDKLERFDPSYKFKASPSDVTTYSYNNIAVTVSDRTICLLDVNSDNTITLLKTLTTSTKCFSICQLNDRTFVVSTMNDLQNARMVDVDGKESDFDNVKFPGKAYSVKGSRCTYIPSRDSLVLTDKFDHTVHIYNTLTGKSFEVKDDQMREPRGVCVGPDDSTFVCSENTNSIIQISPGGDILASTAVDMHYPYAIAVSKDGSRMTVTNSEKGSRKLKLFKIIQ